MSKKEKNIEVIEEEKQKDGQTFLELKIGVQSLGTIIPDENHFQAVFPNGAIFHANSQREAANLLLREYHLHHAG